MIRYIYTQRAALAKYEVMFCSSRDCVSCLLTHGLLEYSKHNRHAFEMQRSSKALQVAFSYHVPSFPRASTSSGSNKYRRAYLCDLSRLSIVPRDWTAPFISARLHALGTQTNDCASRTCVSLLTRFDCIEYFDSIKHNRKLGKSSAY